MKDSGIARSAARFFSSVRARTVRIRQDEEAPSSISGRIPPFEEKKAMPCAAGSRRQVSLGIDIGYSQVNLVKAAKSRDKWEILECASIPIPADAENGSEKFNEFLKFVVQSFCDHSKARIWAIVSSAQAHTQMVRIPKKVSGKHFEAALLWSLKREIAFDEKNYSLGYEIQGETAGEDGAKNDVLCYFAPIQQIEAVKDQFSAIGWPLAGASIVPFAVQNIFAGGVVAQVGDLIACLFIGNGHSRIDLYSGWQLILTRDIKTGISSMIEIVMEELKGRHVAGRQPHAGHISREEAREILSDYMQGVGVPDNVRDKGPASPEVGLPKAGVGDIIEPVLERFARQMERTFKHMESSHGHGRVGKLYISSVMPCDAMTCYFGEQLGIPCDVFDPLKEVLPGKSPDERISLIPAFGIALSDNRTPNFIHSSKEKRQAAYIFRVNRIILAFLAASFLLCIAATAYEWRVSAMERVELAGIERQLQNGPPLTRQLILDMASAARQKAREYAEFSKRYRGVALIGALSDLTPASVSLTSLKANFGDESAKKSGGNNGANSGDTAVVNGVIGGDEGMLEPELVTYVAAIKSSPLFSGISVQAGKIGHARRGSFLPFVLDLKMREGN